MFVFYEHNYIIENAIGAISALGANYEPYRLPRFLRHP